jgi:hypothetical protein
MQHLKAIAHQSKAFEAQFRVFAEGFEADMLEVGDGETGAWLRQHSLCFRAIIDLLAVDFQL